MQCNSGDGLLSIYDTRNAKDINVTDEIDDELLSMTVIQVKIKIKSFRVRLHPLSLSC
jgi:phage/plasmid primase-like uncharacterized protein